MDVSIIIVNWNVRDLLRRCLASIDANYGDLSLEVIVVDNASADGSVLMVQQEFPHVNLIASRENLGYTGGNNLGINEAQGRYLLILNPDTEIVWNALEQMVAYLDEHPDVGVVGPQLLFPDGSVQPARRRFPKAMTVLLQSPLCCFQSNRFVRMLYMDDQLDDEIQAVDWLVGAALMIRRETWRETGPFDEQFFIYADELDWCHRCWDAGWEIHYLPTAQIIHHEHKSADQIPIASRGHYYRSRVLYARKYFGVGWATVVRFFFLLNYAWLLVEETAKWTVGRRQEARRQRINGYWRILRSGLGRRERK